MCQYLKTTDDYNSLPSYISQGVLFKVAQTFKSFLRAKKDFENNPKKYLGKPRIPKYKDKVNGRFTLPLTYMAFRFNPKNPKEIKFNKLLKGFKVKTHLNPEKHKLKEARLVPHKTHITLEIVYELREEPKVNQDLKYLAGIDIGIDNFATISIIREKTHPLIINGKGLKSYNKYFNKKIACLKSIAKKRNNLCTTKRIQNLIKRRSNYIDTWIHRASRITANYLYENKIKAVIIGKNKNWKQSSRLSKNVNQTFIQIPFDLYIKRLTYKCQDLGIEVYTAEESYTSGTSYLDNELPVSTFYNKSRRIHRGLFKTNQGRLINSDVNAAFQIIKKAYKVNYQD